MSVDLIVDSTCKPSSILVVSFKVDSQTDLYIGNRLKSRLVMRSRINTTLFHFFIFCHAKTTLNDTPKIEFLNKKDHPFLVKIE